MIVLKVIGVMLLYLICAWITKIVAIYTDRMSCSANYVYKDYNTYVIASICLWWIILPICIISLLYNEIFDKDKKWSIAIVETMIAKRGEK